MQTHVTVLFYCALLNPERKTKPKPPRKPDVDQGQTVFVRYVYSVYFFMGRVCDTAKALLQILNVVTLSAPGTNPSKTHCLLFVMIYHLYLGPSVV